MRLNYINSKDFTKPLPHSMKQGLKYIYGFIPPRFRYGKVFWQTYNFLQQSQWWSRERLEEYQMQELEKILNHAYENVPYYRRMFDERGLKPKDIQNFDDLKKIPYLTRGIIRENLSDLIANNYPKSKLEYVSTGGSTGIPLGFYQEKGLSDIKEYAFIFTLWKRVGFKIGDKIVVLRGNIIPSASQGKFWEYDPIDKALILSSFHMTDKTLPKYIKKIKKFQPDFIHVYPSVVTILAKFMKKNNIEPFRSVKALLCGSENLYLGQRNLLEEIFKYRVYSWYGHAEKAVLAGECETNTYYHLFPEYGIAELIGKNGKLITEEGASGEIVATGFNNYTMPFIRYKTGDIAVYSAQKCNCGRNYPLLKKIEGRQQEFFVDKAGTLISFIAHDYCLWNFKDKINAYQYIQNKPGKVLLKIDAKSKFPITDIERIKKTFLEFYSNFDIEVIFVENIPRTKSGKFRYFIQNLPIRFTDY